MAGNFRDSMLFKFLEDLTSQKVGLFSEDTAKLYRPFIINKYLCASSDCALYAAEMNRRTDLEPDLQYQYLLHAIRPRKRFLKWLYEPKSEDIDAIKATYRYSTAKAKEVLSLFTEEQLEQLKKRLEKGGIK